MYRQTELLIKRSTLKGTTVVLSPEVDSRGLAEIYPLVADAVNALRLGCEGVQIIWSGESMSTSDLTALFDLLTVRGEERFLFSFDSFKSELEVSSVLYIQRREPLPR